MKKLLLTVGLVVFSLNLQAKEWYQEKGTLHDATMTQWCGADSKNKLATAGDFVAKGYQEKMFKTEIINAIDKNGMGGLKVLAQEVVNGLDESSCNGNKVSPEMKNQKVNSNTALLIALMGWFK
ncbi:hypothetical protein ACTUM7_01325 [Basfia succiniciproducens]|uniref:hypothetical protein n=1 Tax=Basfia succiniciproducens TaxID=653940 RepID=UPI003FCC2F5D